MHRALLLLFMSVPLTSAGQGPTVPPGKRVRVETEQKHRIDGTLMSQTEDSITIAAVVGVRTVASQAVTRVRVSEGRSSGRGAVKGMKIGSAVGGGGGLLFFGGALISSGEISQGNLALLAVFVAAGAVQGAALGAMIGGAIGAEKWTTVYARPLRISLMRTRSGAPGIGASISF